MTPLLRKVLPFALLALALFVLRCRDVQHQRQEGALRAELKATNALLHDLSHRADSLQRVYRVDTLRFFRWRTQWDTVVGNLRLDTLRLTDTVQVPVPVLVTADSTIQACSLALRTCDQIRLTLEQQIAATERQRDLYRKQIPGFSTTAFRTLRDFGLGVLVGAIVK